MAKKSREDWKVYKNVFDNFTERTIFDLTGQGHFDELSSPIALGKEANIFTANKKDDLVIVKIYRLESCNFNKMYSYIAGDPRFTGLEKQRRKVIFSWVQREYRNLLKAREVIKVPKPIAFKNNVLVMEFIGDDEPAPMLKDHMPENKQKFFNEIIDNIIKLKKSGLVHADLSDFNILNHNEKPIFIDFSQGTTVENPNAKEYLERDLKNIINAFKKHIKIDENLIKKVMKA
jgi:RIO kinase 1